MARHCIRQEAAQDLPINGLTTYAKNKLKFALEESRRCKVFKASPDEYEIKEGRSYFPVNLAN